MAALEYCQRVPGRAIIGAFTAKPAMSSYKYIRLDGSKPKLVSFSARPDVIRIRCSILISWRGSVTARHSGIGAGIDGVNTPCCFRIPNNAKTTHLVMENPSSGVAAPIPEA